MSGFIPSISCIRAPNTWGANGDGFVILKHVLPECASSLKRKPLALAVPPSKRQDVSCSSNDGFWTRFSANAMRAKRIETVQTAVVKFFILKYQGLLKCFETTSNASLGRLYSSKRPLLLKARGRPRAREEE